MKVLVLGGCADMAVPLLKLLQTDDTVMEVVLADINEKGARALALEMGRKFSAVYCDATDYHSVMSLMHDQDLVFGYVGPFYVFERKLAKCAIDAGVNYVSIADDYDAYLDVIQLEEPARQAGVKILTGFGNSPGITQVLARKGYTDLGGATRINVQWCAGSDESVGASNLMHLFHIFNGTTLQTIGGEEVAVKTGGGRKRVSFPEPIGEADVYYTGHAESVSLPRNLSGWEEATLHGGVKPGYIVSLLKVLSVLRLFSTHRKRVILAKLFHRIEGWFAADGQNKSVGRVDVYNTNDGQEGYAYFTYVGHIADITSIPAYLAGTWLGQGRFDDLPGGVYSAERLLDKPDTFIVGMKQLGVDLFESGVIRPCC
jgi:lysine 6-dehydrogenase